MPWSAVPSQRLVRMVLASGVRLAAMASGSFRFIAQRGVWLAAAGWVYQDEVSCSFGRYARALGGCGGGVVGANAFSVAMTFCSRDKMAAASLALCRKGPISPRSLS